jgi:hypothetical protein
MEHSCETCNRHDKDTCKRCIPPGPRGYPGVDAWQAPSFVYRCRRDPACKEGAHSRNCLDINLKLELSWNQSQLSTACDRIATADRQLSATRGAMMELEQAIDAYCESGVCRLECAWTERPSGNCPLYPYRKGA